MCWALESLQNSRRARIPTTKALNLARGPAEKMKILLMGEKSLAVGFGGFIGVYTGFRVSIRFDGFCEGFCRC